jgi:hypothetical protein
MTPTSLLPKIAAGCGHRLRALCDEILSTARLSYGVAKPASSRPSAIAEA